MAVADELATGFTEDGNTGSVSLVTSRSRVRMVLSGQVDAAMNSDLVETVHQVEQRGLPVDVDTQTVESMDSTVIALIAHLANRLPAQVRFINPPEVVRSLIDLTQIGDLVDVLDYDPNVATSPQGPPPAA